MDVPTVIALAAIAVPIGTAGVVRGVSYVMKTRASIDEHIAEDEIIHESQKESLDRLHTKMDVITELLLERNDRRR